MTGAQALRRATRDLSEAGIPDAATDARWLLAAALDVPRDRLTLHLQEGITPTALMQFDALIKGRLARRPVSHLLGVRDFYGRRFTVTSDVLDPRPDTETLVDVALEQSFSRVLDLGTGSGCILLTLLSERPKASGLGVDISEAAVRIARQNRAALDLSTRADLGLSDWFQDVKGAFDLIVSNPPYIAADDMADLAPELRRWEPEIALTPGGDGLDAYRMIAASAPRHLTPGGHLRVEIGARQGAAVCDIITAAGFQNLRIAQDLDNRDRVVSAQI